MSLSEHEIKVREGSVQITVWSGSQRQGRVITLAVVNTWGEGDPEETAVDLTLDQANELHEAIDILRSKQWAAPVRCPHCDGCGEVWP